MIILILKVIFPLSFYSFLYIFEKIHLHTYADISNYVPNNLNRYTLSAYYELILNNEMQ